MSGTTLPAWAPCRVQHQATGFGVTVAAAGTALALGLTAALSAAPTRSTNAIRSAGTSAGTGTVHTAAFILTSNVNGTDSLAPMSLGVDPAGRTAGRSDSQ